MGILTWVAPGITALSLLFYIAIWAIATGVLEMVTAIRLRKVLRNEWMLGLAGLAAVVFGIALMVQPDAGALAVAWLIAGFAMIFGVFMAALSLRMRSLGHRLETQLA